MNLKEMRFKKQMTQWVLSLKSSVPQSRISLIENGVPPKETEKKRLCKALDIKSELIEWPIGPYV